MNYSVNKSVLLVGNFLSKSRSTFSVCEELASRLANSGWHIITTSAQEKRIQRLVDMVTTTWKNRHEYSVAQVDVYSGPSLIWAEVVCWVLRLLKKRYILTLHGGNLPAFSLRWPKRVRRLLGTATNVTAPSRYLMEKMRIYREDILLIPNALDLSKYSFRLRERPHPRLVWIRAFQETYNPTLAPRVISLLSKNIPDIKLLMIGPDKGDGSFERTLQVAAELRVRGNIELIGKVPKSDIPKLINNGDIFLNTTNVDNVPVTILEAMACGLCIVSTNVGGLPYLLQHEKDALLIPPDNPKEMADAVSRLLTEIDLARRISQSARRKVEHFDWSVILPQWEELLAAAPK